MIKISIATALLAVASVVFAAEVSVFDAGNLGQDNPYGLNDNEKLLLDNNKKIREFELLMESQKIAIDGLQSLVSSLNSKVAELEDRVLDLEQAKKMPKKTRVKPVSADFRSQSKDKISSQAFELYKQGKLEEAKDRYNYLVSNKFNLANTHFMLGEIYYSQNSFANAADNYKKSYFADKNSKQIPIILLKTAKSLEKLGDTKNANKFYEILKTKYPDAPQAQNLK